MLRNKLIQCLARYTCAPDDVVEVMLTVEQRQQMLCRDLRKAEERGEVGCGYRTHAEMRNKVAAAATNLQKIQIGGLLYKIGQDLRRHVGRERRYHDQRAERGIAVRKHNACIVGCKNWNAKAQDGT